MDSGFQSSNQIITYFQLVGITHNIVTVINTFGMEKLDTACGHFDKLFIPYSGDLGG
jgi:hypothetical protein